MYYVTDPKSRFFRRLVSFWGIDNDVYDHLARQIDIDFSSWLYRDLPEVRLKKDWRSIEDILKYSKGFYHFTNISGLPSIFADGFISSRNIAVERGYVEPEPERISFNHQVNDRSTVQDHARFTFQSNNPIIYHCQGINDDKYTAQPCIFTLDHRLALIKGSYFSDTNANSSNATYSSDLSLLRTIPFYQLQNGGYVTTFNRGAELLYPTGAPVNFINRISFRSIGEFKHAQNIASSNFDQEVNSWIFGKGKEPTYIEDICIADRISEPRGLPDKIYHSPDSIKSLNLMVNNVKQGQQLKVEAKYGEDIRYNFYNLLPQMRINLDLLLDFNGEHTITVKIAGKREDIIYRQTIKIG